MPASPERDSGGVIRDAAHHVLRRVNPINKRPEAEKTPWDEEFEPEDVQAEVGHQCKL